MMTQFAGIDVVASLRDGNELDDSVMLNNPDIIILDLNMPGKNGYETCDWLAKNYPDVKVIVLTMYDSEIPLIRLLQKGVKGFLKKDVHPKELLAAIDSVAANGFYYTHEVTGKLGSVFFKQHSTNSSFDRIILNETEIMFLTLASSDMTYKEIAETMNVSPRVVDAYRDNLFSKLQVKSRVALAVYSLKNGIINF